MLSPQHSHRPPSLKTVLVVEDDADLRRIFANVLFWAGFRVEQADDGQTRKLTRVEPVRVYWG